MATLNYRPNLCKDPRIYPAATHLQVWAILGYILCAVATVVALFFILMFVYLVTTGAPGSFARFAMILVLIALFLIVGIYIWRFSRRIDQLRQRVYVQEWSALAVCIDIFTRQRLFSILFGGGGLVILAGSAIRLDPYNIVIGITLFVITLVPHLSLFWTLRILRRAHTAAADSNRSQLTFS